MVMRWARAVSYTHLDVYKRQVQARGQAAVAGECFHDGLAVANHTGLNALGQPRAAQGGTAPLFHILGTELAAHIFGLSLIHS